MDKRKGIAIIVAVLLAFGFNFLYNNTIVYWDAYAYEIFLSDTSEPDMTLQISQSDLLDYPDAATVLETVYAEGWDLITYEYSSAMTQFDELIESKGGNMDAGYIYLELDGEFYNLMYTTYGGMETEPRYMMLEGVFILIASGLVIHELVVNYMGWGRKTELQ